MELRITLMITNRRVITKVIVIVKRIITMSTATRCPNLKQIRPNVGPKPVKLGLNSADVGQTWSTAASSAADT